MELEPGVERLLACLRGKADEIKSASLEQWTEAEWEEVLQQAAWHNVAPLLYQRLWTLDPRPPIPDSVVETLREIYLYNSARNVRLYHELAQVLQVFQDHDIPVIALKGAHLAEMVYGNTALRPMCDLDLLVREGDLSRVTGKLRERGYDSSRPFGIEVETAGCQHLPIFYKPGATPMEIHWNIEYPTSPMQIDIKGLWERARPATIAGVNVQVLSAEDLCLHLCLHISYHHSCRVGLIHFWDLTETIRHYREEIDWETVQQRARRWGAGNCVYLTLLLARELVGAPIPEELLMAFHPKDFEPRWAAWAKELLLDQEACAEDLSLSDTFAQLWGARRIQDKASLFLKNVFPPPKVLAQRDHVLPGSLRIYGYYLWRLVSLPFRHFRAAWRLLRREEGMVASAERKNKEAALRDWLASG